MSLARDTPLQFPVENSVERPEGAAFSHAPLRFNAGAVSLASANPSSAKGCQMARQSNSGGGGCGCFFAVVVVLILGAGLFYLVKEDKSLDDPEIVQGIREIGEGFTPPDTTIVRESLEAKLFLRVNDHRQKHGRNPLQPDAHLSAIALAHSRDMVENDYFPLDHINLLGENPTERARKVGYECIKPTSIGIAENSFKAYRYSSVRYGLIGWIIPAFRSYNWLTEDALADRIVDGWIASSGHYKNLMDSRFTQSGLGVAFGTLDGEEHSVLVTHKFC